MATKYFQGGASPVVQVETHTVGGTIEADDRFKIIIGNKTLDVTGASTTANDVADNIKTAFDALSSTAWPEYKEMTMGTPAGGAATVTGATAGKPFTITLLTVEANGDAADAQTYVQAAVTAATGSEHYDDDDNWSDGSVPGAADTAIVENFSGDIRYGLDNDATAITNFHARQSFTGTIGNPATNVDAPTGLYPEYRDPYLQLNATNVYLGEGTGDGSGRVKLQLDNTTAVYVTNHGTRLETGVPTTLLRNEGADVITLLDVSKGDVGVALYAGETADITELKVSYQTSVTGDSTVVCGAGATVDNVTQDGGVVEVDSVMVNVKLYGGTFTHKGSGTITLLEMHGSATFINNGTGIITTTKCYDDSHFDNSQGSFSRTVTNMEMHDSSTLSDPQNLLTTTNGIDIYSSNVTVTKPFPLTHSYSAV